MFFSANGTKMGLMVVTRDPSFDSYGIPTLWEPTQQRRPKTR
jgi:hypothetical protein